jgi:exosortase/archaeosortase family protein
MSAEALRRSQARARHRAERRSADRSRPCPGEPAASRIVRLATSLSLLGLALVMPTQQQRVRDLEAWLASHVITTCGVQTGYSGGSLAMAWFAESAKLHVGLVITPDCTIALLTIPFLVATAALLAWQRAPLCRTITGLVVAVALLELLNQARLLTIAATVLIMGYPGGYYWGHTIFGSLLLIFGLTGVLALFAVLTLKRGTGGRTR